MLAREKSSVTLQLTDKTVMHPLLDVFLVNCLRLAITCLDIVTDLLFGWTISRGSRRERELAPPNAAQLVSVIAKATHQPDFPVGNTNCVYALKHVDYVDPRIVLRDSKICLSHLTNDTAVFAVPKTIEDFFDTEKSPFLAPAVYNLAEKYILMSISTFHELAEEVGDPKVKLCMVVSTLRSGGTLILQCLNRLPNSLCLSEAFALDSITLLHHQQKMTRNEAARAMRNIIRMIARPNKDKKTERIVFKVAEFTVPWLDLIRETFPDMVLIKSTRHPLTSVVSLRKVTDVCFGGLAGKFGAAWRNWTGPAFNVIMRECCGLSPNQLLNTWWWWGLISEDDISILWYGCNLAGIQRHKQVFDLTVLFEDLIGRSEATVRRILDSMEVYKEAQVWLAMSAFRKDSQNGVFNRDTRTLMDQAMKDRCNNWFQVLKLPLTVDVAMEEFREYVKA